jgi:hypothetical protein
MCSTSAHGKRTGQDGPLRGLCLACLPASAETRLLPLLPLQLCPCRPHDRHRAESQQAPTIRLAQHSSSPDCTLHTHTLTHHPYIHQHALARHIKYNPRHAAILSLHTPWSLQPSIKPTSMSEMLPQPRTGTASLQPALNMNSPPLPSTMPRRIHTTTRCDVPDRQPPLILT